MIIWWVFNQCGAILNQWKVFLKRVESVFEACKFEFNFEWNEGYDKGWLKNLYLLDLTFVLGDLKFIRKIIQRSTTSMLITSLNFNNLDIKLRFEVSQILFQNFSETLYCYCASVSGSRQTHCRLQFKCRV